MLHLVSSCFKCLSLSILIFLLFPSSRFAININRLVAVFRVRSHFPSQRSALIINCTAWIIRLALNDRTPDTGLVSSRKKIFYFATIYSGCRTSEWISESCELEFFWMARWNHGISFLMIVVHFRGILILLTANLIAMRCDSRMLDELLNKIEILFWFYQPPTLF